MESKYRVIISDRSLSMLTDHVSFLSNVSVDAAIKLKQTIINEIKELGIFPEKYPWLTSEFLPKNKYHKKVISNRYIVIYQIKENTVYIDYIINGRQDYSWLIS